MNERAVGSMFSVDCQDEQLDFILSTKGDSGGV